MYVELQACVPSALGYRPILSLASFQTAVLFKKACTCLVRKKVALLHNRVAPFATQNVSSPAASLKPDRRQTQTYNWVSDRFSCSAVNHLAVFTLPSDPPPPSRT